METPQNLADNAELALKLATEAQAYFERFKTDREELDDLNSIADYMYACSQNRSLQSSEMTAALDKSEDTRASVGSTIFFRQVNTLASQLIQVLRSKKDLFKYNTLFTENNDMSAEDAKTKSEQAMALARWTRKADLFDERIPEFAVHAFKYSNVFALCQQKRSYKTLIYTQPEYRQVGVDATGDPIMAIVGEKREYVDVIKDNYPSITFPHVDMIYADRYIPSISQQNCVVVLSLKNRSEIYSDVAMGFYSKDQYDKLTEGDEWDGSEGSALKEKESDNREKDWNPQGSKMFLVWDVYIRAPIDGAKWDEKNPPALYWATFVGNTLDQAKLMRLERNPDPDDEIPIKEIRINPDKSDTLYHTTNAEVVRSAYAADCTLLNLAIDNMAVINDPPMEVLDGAHRVKDFSFSKGARWPVFQMGAIKQFDIRDNTIQTVNLRSQIQSEVKQALATDPAMMGEYAGSRTSATEFLGVNSGTKQPHLAQIGYILQQLLPWMAKKYMSYWQAYGTPEQVVQISDADKIYVIKPKEVAGEYDVAVDLIDEYEDDLVKQQQISQVMQIIGSSPFFQSSAFHTVNPAELLKEWFNRMGFTASRIITDPSGVDAEYAAQAENNAMLHGGVAVRPMQGENIQVHLRIHKAERLRWRGLEDSDDDRAKNLPLLDQHIAETEQMQKMGQQNTGSLPVGPQNQTPGEVIGNEQAAALGAMFGGGTGLQQ